MSAPNKRTSFDAGGQPPSCDAAPRLRVEKLSVEEQNERFLFAPHPSVCFQLQDLEDRVDQIVSLRKIMEARVALSNSSNAAIATTSPVSVAANGSSSPFQKLADYLEVSEDDFLDNVARVQTAVKECIEVGLCLPEEFMGQEVQSLIDNRSTISRLRSEAERCFKITATSTGEFPLSSQERNRLRQTIEMSLAVLGTLETKTLRLKAQLTEKLEIIRDYYNATKDQTDIRLREGKRELDLIDLDDDQQFSNRDRLSAGHRASKDARQVDSRSHLPVVSTSEPPSVVPGSSVDAMAADAYAAAGASTRSHDTVVVAKYARPPRADDGLDADQNNEDWRVNICGRPPEFIPEPPGDNKLAAYGGYEHTFVPRARIAAGLSTTAHRSASLESTATYVQTTRHTTGSFLAADDSQLHVPSRQQQSTQQRRFSLAVENRRQGGMDVLPPHDGGTHSTSRNFSHNYGGRSSRIPVPGPGRLTGADNRRRSSADYEYGSNFEADKNLPAFRRMSPPRFETSSAVNAGSRLGSKVGERVGQFEKHSRYEQQRPTSPNRRGFQRAVGDCNPSLLTIDTDFSVSQSSLATALGANSTSNARELVTRSVEFNQTIRKLIGSASPCPETAGFAGSSSAGRAHPRDGSAPDDDDTCCDEGEDYSRVFNQTVLGDIRRSPVQGVVPLECYGRLDDVRTWVQHDEQTIVSVSKEREVQSQKIQTEESGDPCSGYVETNLTPQDARMIKKLLAEEVKDPGILLTSSCQSTDDNGSAEQHQHQEIKSNGQVGSDSSLSSTLESALMGDEKAVHRIRTSFEKSMSKASGMGHNDEHGGESRSDDEDEKIVELKRFVDKHVKKCEEVVTRNPAATLTDLVAACKSAHGPDPDPPWLTTLYNSVLSQKLKYVLYFFGGYYVAMAAIYYGMSTERDFVPT